MLYFVHGQARLSLHVGRRSGNGSGGDEADINSYGNNDS
jgi:hypothetical protein